LGVKVFCWHTYNGYWAGLGGDKFKARYRIKDERFRFSPRYAPMVYGKGGDGGTTNTTADANFFPLNLLSEACGFPQDPFYVFYGDFYDFLKKRGVAGVKVDAICWAEAFARGKGGRVKLMKSLVNGLERAGGENFGGAYIGCSSMSNDFFYNAATGGVTRLSNDYVPGDPASHGRHVLENAHNSFWLRDILFPDWDMFQSGNTAGRYHAVARAVGGGPIYMTDEPGKQDYGVIKAACARDGSLPEAGLAAVTRDCLFEDGASSGKPVKIFNTAGRGFLLGAFNCRGDGGAVRGSLSVRDIEGISGGEYFVYGYFRGPVGKFTDGGSWSVSLGQYECDVFAVVPVLQGTAVVGLIDKYNAPGYVKSVERYAAGLTVALSDGGRLAVYSEKPPAGVSAAYEYKDKLIVIDAARGAVTVTF
jgi:raffinose synthase